MSYRCQNPLCTEYTQARTYCASCQILGFKETRHTFYDKHLRDPESKAFYATALWKAVRAQKLTEQPWCSRCFKPANTVHHLKALRECTVAEKTDPNMLQPLCSACHNIIEAEMEKSQ
jgi:5-methylcytosine-specific restriction endonuclease McrA